MVGGLSVLSAFVCVHARICEGLDGRICVSWGRGGGEFGV
jgi:hypothetical protein